MRIFKFLTVLSTSATALSVNRVRREEETVGLDILVNTVSSADLGARYGEGPGDKYDTNKLLAMVNAGGFTQREDEAGEQGEANIDSERGEDGERHGGHKKKKNKTKKVKQPKDKKKKLKLPKPTKVKKMKGKGYKNGTKAPPGSQHWKKPKKQLVDCTDEKLMLKLLEELLLPNETHEDISNYVKCKKVNKKKEQKIAQGLHNQVIKEQKDIEKQDEKIYNHQLHHILDAADNYKGAGDKGHKNHKG